MPSPRSKDKSSRTVPAPRRKYKSAKAKAKSETVSNLESATDATLTIQQALDLTVVFAVESLGHQEWQQGQN